MHSHAGVPTVDAGRGETARIYFAARDVSGRSRIAFVDVEAADPSNVRDISAAPVLPLGELGTFDDNGTTPSCVVNFDSRKYLYYIGWNPQVTVSYRLAIGLAISDDGGRTFSKLSQGPLLDRSVEEPFFNTAPCVILENGIWRMWYVSCTGWEIADGHPEPIYHVKYGESDDGIHWRRSGHVCIDYDERTGSIGRPYVYRHRGRYHMFYSYRGRQSYRTDTEQSYRLGYAESADGMTWTRRDDAVGIHRSSGGWDSDMIEYACLYRHGGTIIMLYNGNGFGRSGMGYAVLEDCNVAIRP